MTDFFAINVDRFGGTGQEQLQVFGAAIDKKMQIKWAAPIMKSVTTLDKYEPLIPPMIRQQFDDIAQGGTGYQGYRRVVSNIAEATWDWQVDVPCPTGGSGAGRLPIRCRRGLLEGDVVEMGEPFL
jgi:hypothetical protein